MQERKNLKNFSARRTYFSIYCAEILGQIKMCRVIEYPPLPYSSTEETDFSETDITIKLKGKPCGFPSLILS